MVMDPITDIRPGIPVYTLDGTFLGEVKEVQAQAFKVNASLQPDYWIARADVLSFTRDRVTLKFTQGEIGDHKVAAPAGA